MGEKGLPFYFLKMENIHMIDERIVEFVNKHELTAIMTANDILAIGTKKFLERAGLEIPKDISLMGYDNIKVVEFLDIPLTTVDQHEEEMGARAANIMLNLINSPTSVKRIHEVVLEPTLIKRASTAPVSLKLVSEANKN